MKAEGKLTWTCPVGAMSPALKKTLSLRQHEIAKALGGRIDAPKKSPGVIDDEWIKKANEWWAKNVRCWAGLWGPLAQPPYILADSLGLINLKEMVDANHPNP